MYTILSVILVSIISLVGVLTFFFDKKKLDKKLIYFVSLSVGTLLGGSFFHLIPEAFEEGNGNASIFILLGILVFFVLEKFVHWQHCHDVDCEKHPHAFSYMILAGDVVHNFIDGMIVAASYMVSVPLGITTTIAVIFHEIPQEFGDFGSLLYAGFSRAKALLFNFLTALTAILGAVIILILGTKFSASMSFLIPFTAGGFIYIAAADLIPELHKPASIKKSLGQLIFLLVGIGIMWTLLRFE